MGAQESLAQTGIVLRGLLIEAMTAKVVATEARPWTHPSPLGPGRRISPPPACGFHGELGSAPAPAQGAPGPLPRGERLKSGLQLTLELGRQTSPRQGVLPPTR